MAKQPRHSGHDDDQQLANLILLLRLPNASSSKATDDDVYDYDDGTGSATATAAAAAAEADAEAEADAAAALRTALEQDNCQLLRFMDRLLRHYETGNKAEAESTVEVEESDVSNANYAYLRLVVRIAFLSYVSTSSESSASTPIAEGSTSNNDGHERAGTISKTKLTNYSEKSCVWKCECRLLVSLLAALSGRPTPTPSSITGDDILALEISCAVEGLLVKLSVSTSLIVINGLWNKALDILLKYRRSCRKERGGVVNLEQHTSSTSLVAEDNHQMTDTQTMIQTIHSILDRSEYGISVSSNYDYDMQYDASILSCLTSFLAWCEDGEKQGRHMPKFTQDVLFELILWSQENQHFSWAIHVLINKYLRLCIERKDAADDDPMSSQQGALTRFRNVFVLAQTSDKASPLLIDGKEEEFAIAMRSFLFYGLIVLCNSDLPGESFLKTFRTNVSIDEKSSTILRRGEVLSLILDLWNLFGVDWMFVPQSKMGGADVESPFWWVRSGESKIDDRQSIGPTWPFCMLFRLAVGEYRLGLGRYLSIVEDGGIQNLDEKDCEDLVLDIMLCSRVVTETVALMTSMVDDENDGAIRSPWSPDAILHVRTSLEDALNSSMQYLTLFPGNLNSTEYRPLAMDDVSFPMDSKDYDEIWYACCFITGSIANDLELDQLLTISSDAESIGSNHSLVDDRDIPSFLLALRGGIQFCTSLAERQCLSDLHCHETLEFEPLIHLLPSTASLVSHLAFDDDDEGASNLVEVLKRTKEAVSEDGWLVFAISTFLRRLSDQWRGFWQGREVLTSNDSFITRRTNTVLSIVDMCVVIVSSVVFMVTSARKINYVTLVKGADLSIILNLWKRNLVDICEWPNEVLRCSSAETLDKVSQLLDICSLGAESTGRGKSGSKVT